MQLNVSLRFLGGLAIGLMVSTRVVAGVTPTTGGMARSERAAAMPGDGVVQLAWCEAMGGYPSYEAQARAQARERAAAKRKTDQEAARMQSTQVRTDQQALSDLGYYRGKVDGRAGRATIVAVSDFRRENNLGAGTTLDASSRELIASGKAVRKPSTARSEDRLRLREDQRALADLGFYKGKVDGIPGKRTNAAIRDFKKQNGFDPSTDTLDAAARTKLAELHGASAAQ
jgi:peptidoglycan hydrolase-like protein with peptidoglycan-binding domain